MMRVILDTPRVCSKTGKHVPTAWEHFRLTQGPGFAHLGHRSQGTKLVLVRSLGCQPGLWLGLSCSARKWECPTPLNEPGLHE